MAEKTTYLNGPGQGTGRMAEKNSLRLFFIAPQ